MADSTFSRHSTASSAISASSASSSVASSSVASSSVASSSVASSSVVSSINDTQINNKNSARLAKFAQQLSLYRDIAAKGTKLSRQEIFSTCSSWPINLTLEAVFIFYPLDGPSGPFEHKRNKNGQATEYSRWYFMRTVMDWRKPMRVCVELREVVWGHPSRGKTVEEGRKRDNVSWEGVGPMGERKE